MSRPKKVSLIYLMRNTGISEDFLNQECDDMDLVDLSEHIVDYREYGLRLGLSEADIKNCERNPALYFSVKAITAAVFKEWHKKFCYMATYRELVQVAIKLNDGEGARKICEMCRNRHVPVSERVIKEDSVIAELPPGSISVPETSRQQILDEEESPQIVSDRLTFEPYEQVFITPLIGIVLTIATYLCKKYWDKYPHVGVYETVGLAICLAVICLIFLHLPNILLKAFANKKYASVVVFFAIIVIAFILGPGVNLLSSFINSITAATSSARGVQDIENRDDVPIRATNPIQEEHHAVSPGDTQKSENSTNCAVYSQQLLSKAILTSPKAHHVKGQVEMFERTIHLSGKPSHLVFSGEPSEYEGSALDVMNRQHNTGAKSSVSARHAVEKALVYMCENLKRVKL